MFFQVLSESVSKALTLTAGSEVQKTARFVLMFDKFFDLLNVRNFTEGARNRKPFPYPYHKGDDQRLQVMSSVTCIPLFIIKFQWSKEVFLPYLEEWKNSVNGRVDVTTAEKRNMQLSSETLLGLKRTSKQFIYT